MCEENSSVIEYLFTLYYNELDVFVLQAFYPPRFIHNWL